MSTFAVLKIETISKCILYLVRIDFNFNQHRGNRFGRERRFNCSTCAQLKKQTVNCCTRYQAWTIAPHAVPPFIIFHGSRYRASSFTIRPVCFAFSRHFARNLRRGALRGRKKKREREGGTEKTSLLSFFFQRRDDSFIRTLTCLRFFDDIQRKIWFANLSQKYPKYLFNFLTALSHWKNTLPDSLEPIYNSFFLYSLTRVKNIKSIFDFACYNFLIRMKIRCISFLSFTQDERGI